jgi:hypothetical protein
MCRINPCVDFAFKKRFGSEDNKDLLNRYRILNVETGKDDGKHQDLELHYLELRKFRKHFDELATALDRWAAFLTHAHELDKRNLPAPLAQAPAIVLLANGLTPELVAQGTGLTAAEVAALVTERITPSAPA